MKFTTSAILFAFFVIILGALNVVAVPLSLAARAVISPKITLPTPGDSFKRGTTTTVEWETDNIPAGTPNIGRILLARPDSTGREHLDVDNPLAKGFLLTEGSVDITWPTSTEAGEGYYLALFGDSANIYGPYTLV